MAPRFGSVATVCKSVTVRGFGSLNRMSTFQVVSVNHSRFILGQHRNNWSIHSTPPLAFDSENRATMTVNGYANRSGQGHEPSNSAHPQGFVASSTTKDVFICWSELNHEFLLTNYQQSNDIVLTP